MEALSRILNGNSSEEVTVNERILKDLPEYGRIQQQYNATDTSKFLIYEVRKIQRAEAERAMCHNCKGLPCKKRICKCGIPNISNEDGNLVIRYSNCKHFNKQVRQEITEKAKRKAAVPIQYKDISLRDYTIDSNNIEAVRRAQNFIKNPSMGIYYHGNCGSGKSMLAAIIVNELTTMKNTIYMDVPAIMDKLRALQRKDDGDIESEMNKLSTTPILIMDDIGAERTTEWTTERLYIIINNRNNNRLPTIYTSNYALNHLYIHYGENILAERLCSRINATATTIELKGNDRRKQPCPRD